MGAEGEEMIKPALISPEFVNKFPFLPFIVLLA